MLMFSITGCQGTKLSNSKPADKPNTVYLASWRGELGKFDTQTHNFEPLYNELYVEVIFGKTGVNTLIVLAHPGGCSDPLAQLPSLYQVSLDDLTSTHLASGLGICPSLFLRMLSCFRFQNTLSGYYQREL